MIDSPMYHPSEDIFGTRFSQNEEGLPPASLKVAEFIRYHPLEAIALSAMELARRIGTSDATVVRTAKMLGFEGLADLRSQLAAKLSSQYDLAVGMEHALDDVNDNAEKAMDDALEMAKSGYAALNQPEMRELMAAGLELLNAARRIAVFGIGPTAFIAGYMCHRLQREGRNCVLLDQCGIALADQLLALHKGDNGFILAYGPSYPEVETAADQIRRLGGKIVLISDSAMIAQRIRPQVFLQLPRGRPDKVAFHGTTMTCIEMLLFGLASSRRSNTLKSLESLRKLRAELTRYTQHISLRKTGNDGPDEPAS